MTPGLNTELNKNQIIVYSDKYNNDKNYQKEIDQELIEVLKR